MMRRAAMMCFVGVSMVMGLLHFSAPAYASSGLSAPLTTFINGQQRSCSGTGDAKGALMGVIVPCIANTIQDATIRMARGFSAFMKPTFYAFLTLVTAFFGFKILQGEGEVQKRFIMLLLKVGFVVMFINNFAGLTPAVFAAIKEGQGIVMSAIAPTYSASKKIGIVTVNVNVTQNNIHCDISKYNPGGPGGVLWAQMDCMLGKILGFAIGNNGSGVNMALAASVIGLMGGMMFGGSFGLAVFFAAIGFLISLLMFVLKVAFAYINGMMIAGIYIIISPLFIPLVLTQPTAQYFEKWWKGLVAAMLMPVIVTGYACVALMVYDRMLLADDSMINQLFDKAIFKEAVEECEPRQIMPTNAGNTATVYDSLGLPADQRNMTTNAFNSVTTMFGVGGNEMCVVSVDFARYAVGADRPEAKDSSEAALVALLLDFAKLLITAIIMKQGLEQLMKSLAQLTGVSSVAAAMSPQKGMEQNIVTGVERMKQTMQQSMSAPASQEELARHGSSAMGPAGATGGLFIERLTGATGGTNEPTGGAVAQGFQAFISTLSNRR